MRFARTLLILLFGLVAAPSGSVRADPGPSVALKTQPENLDDLRALQRQVAAVVRQVSPAVVGVRVGRGMGSGVIVSDDGLVLTAGHVSGEPGQDCSIILPDGRIVRGRTLGAYRTIDSGMIKIIDPVPGTGTSRKWPFVELGRSAPLGRGQWCVALGHPGGYKPGRTPPLRLGRILDARPTVLRTDCTLVGGDSGGPLFDLDGKLIGIHSRIGSTVSDNLHVPVDTYRETWNRLTASEAWGEPIDGGRGGRGGGGGGRAGRGRPFLGIDFDNGARERLIGEVEPDSPAEKAGLKPGDVIMAFDGKPVANFVELTPLVAVTSPGDTVNLEIRREGKTLKLKLQVGRRTP